MHEVAREVNPEARVVYVNYGQSTTSAVPEAAQATPAPVGVSLSHLRWWMTWATPDTAVRNPSAFTCSR